MSETDHRQQLAAILAADATGYSRLMAADEHATVAALDAARAQFRKEVESSGGRVIDTAGDSVLAIFETVVGAVGAALAIQDALAALTRETPQEHRLQFRIGVHLGDIIQKTDHTIYGNGVNVAARLQALAEPGGIAVSDAVKGAVCGRIAATFHDQGQQAVKNLSSAVHWHRVYRAASGQGISVSHARSAADVSRLPSIAILPFKPATMDEEQASFADGLRIDVQAALVKIAGLIVIAPGTTNTYRSKDVSAQQAATEMGVRYLLEGSIRKSGPRLRVTVSLLDASCGQIVWNDTYNRVFDDAFEVQDEITEKIVTALDVRLVSGEQAKVWRKAITNPKARELFYHGVHEFMKGQKEANAFARGKFEQVARIAPETSLGPTHVAFSHWLDAFRGWSASPAQSFEQAAEWAERAMSMEDADGQAHVVMGHIHLLRREHDKALEVAEQAVGVRPNCTHANGHLGNILYYCGRAADAADRIEQAMRYSPMHPPWFKVLLAASFADLGIWDKAASVARDALRMKSDDVDARLVLIRVAHGSGDDAAARQLAREIAQLRPDFSTSKWAATQPYRDGAALERIVSGLNAAGLTA
jgi:adenylate cyclase